MTEAEKKMEIYNTNKACINEIMEKVSAVIRGRCHSFRNDILNTRFAGSIPICLDEEKLEILIGEMLDGWEEFLKSRTGEEPDTKKSWAQDYIDARRELYENYLYCAMGVIFTWTEDGKDVTFESLLAMAKEFQDSWCVMEDSQGRYNERKGGLSADRAFQYYEKACQERLQEEEWDGRNHLEETNGEWNRSEGTVDKWYRVKGTSDKRYRVEGTYQRMTNLGDYRRMDLEKDSVFGRIFPDFESDDENAELSEKRTLEEASEEELQEKSTREEASEEMLEEEAWDEEYDDDVMGGWMMDEFGFTQEEWELMNSIRDAQLTEDLNISLLPGGYPEACEHFSRLFRSAEISTVRTFYKDMEEIVDMYLLSKDLTMLTDVDDCKTMYGIIYDSALKHAKKFARGKEWDSR